VAYEIEFAESVQGHLRALTARERAIVLDAAERQLLHEPLKETRHRKPLRPNPIARGSYGWDNCGCSTT